MLIKLELHTDRQACRWRYGSGYKVAKATNRKYHSVTIDNGHEFAEHNELLKNWRWMCTFLIPTFPGG
ncbi:hypothetical protein NTGBS_820001 [Candidatus Nitrotoga sp. BS]|uniref:hypothetical protein n=1 Tax=Candidatus Nitrotoga sp. BS TaxID=2890408 RepID=UPI001EF2514D|nr:hypothetical protein [Candidatus Nitrotoga sp. BS]CAH1210040.1 hypothetical protein NTGBS_820001 [Candidatus Nitrotoga sp. BS]